MQESGVVMPNAADGDASIQPEARNSNYRSIVSDLTALMEQVQASMQLIEAAIVRESPSGNQEIATNVIVLDDVTPRYGNAKAVLSACNASLGEAIHFLLDTKPSSHARDSSAGRDRPPIRLASRA
jgi:hypothetical protein